MLKRCAEELSSGDPDHGKLQRRLPASCSGHKHGTPSSHDLVNFGILSKAGVCICNFVNARLKIK